MKNFFRGILRGGDDKYFFDAGVVSESGRLTEDGTRLYVDLLFTGKTHKQARDFILKESKKYVQDA